MENKNEKKKEYVAPAIEVVKLHRQTVLQQGSFNGTLGMVDSSKDTFV